MFSRYSQQVRQLLLISLMACALIGVQLVQASPLHEHTSHSVDCALCHLQLSDDALFQHASSFAVAASGTRYNQLVAEFYSFRNPSPYQGRAPPLFFR